MTALGITIAFLALSPNLLRAAVVVTDAATFVIAIDANDAVSVDCSGGFVRVTDDGTPTTYTTACASVTLLRVTADGVFDNTIDLSAVTAAAFPQLAAGGAQPVTLNGGGGNDTLTGSALGAVIRGGPGNDVMSGGAADDAFTWVPGDGSDTIQGGAGSDVLAFVVLQPRQAGELSQLPRVLVHLARRPTAPVTHAVAHQHRPLGFLVLQPGPGAERREGVQIGVVRSQVGEIRVGFPRRRRRRAEMRENAGPVEPLPPE
jgi:hypothetical protein